jgi:hypothetical protein
MTRKIAHITFDEHQPDEISRFWAEAMGYADGGGWVVLQDPEGNEFCVERSQAERG